MSREKDESSAFLQPHHKERSLGLLPARLKKCLALLCFGLLYLLAQNIIHKAPWPFRDVYNYGLANNKPCTEAPCASVH